MPFPNEVYIEPKEKERLIELLTEADTILNKYPSSSIASYDTVTAMSWAQDYVRDAKKWVECLHTSDEAK